MRALIINGPNLNMLGIREPEIYGSKSYSELCSTIEKHAEKRGVEIKIFQSNSEGEIVDEIQAALGKFDGIIINPASYTHTSVAILDALSAVGLASVEVHLTDVGRREEFRKISYAGLACEKKFVGLGFEGYLKALDYLISKYG